MKRRTVQLAAATRGATPSTDWQATVRRDDVDAVFIATTHDQLAPVVADAAPARKPCCASLRPFTAEPFPARLPHDHHPRPAAHFSRMGRHRPPLSLEDVESMEKPKTTNLQLARGSTLGQVALIIDGFLVLLLVGNRFRIEPEGQCPCDSRARSRGRGRP